MVMAAAKVHLAYLVETAAMGKRAVLLEAGLEVAAVVGMTDMELLEAREAAPKVARVMAASLAAEGGTLVASRVSEPTEADLVQVIQAVG